MSKNSKRYALINDKRTRKVVEEDIDEFIQQTDERCERGREARRIEMVYVSPRRTMHVRLLCKDFAPDR
jgi:hypothetical protein